MIWWIFIIALVFVSTVGAICGLIAAKRADEHFEKKITEKYLTVTRNNDTITLT